MCDQLDMRRPQELVDWLDADEPVTAVEQDARITRKRCGIAGDRDTHWNLAPRKRLNLGPGTRARRIEYNGIEGS